MNKKQIIKLLDKEVGLFRETEDENSLGELYLSKLEFKKVEKLLQAIEQLRVNLEETIKFYKRKIKKNERGFYIKLPPHTFLKDKVFKYDGDLIILDPRNIVFSNNIFYGRELNE